MRFGADERKAALRFYWVVGIVTPVALALTGCFADDPPIAGPRCSDKPPQPLTVEQVESALRRQGIDAERTDAVDLCTSRTAAVFENGNSDGAFEEDGFVDCVLLTREGLGPLPPAELRRVHEEADSKKVRFLLANADCAVYFDEARKAEQVGQLAAAMRELEAGLSNVPPPG